MKYFMKTGLFMVLLLIGCNDVEQQASIKTIHEIDNSSSPFSNEEKPPSLTFNVGETEIKTYRGTYSWRVFDEKSKQTVTTYADFMPPTDMVNIEKAITFDLQVPVHLHFEVPPTHYELRVWDDKTTIASYNSFDEIKERGKYLLEIVGYWEEGRATYVAALDIFTSD